MAIVGQTIQAAYKLGDIVIVGRGGQAVLRGSSQACSTFASKRRWTRASSV